MSELLAAITTGVTAFSATNVDDLVITFLWNNIDDLAGEASSFIQNSVIIRAERI